MAAATTRAGIFLGRCLPLRVAVPSQNRINRGWHQQHYLCSKVVETELPDTKEYRRAVYKMNRSFIGRFWDWLHTDLGEDQYEMGETEKREREILLQRIQDMYFAKPPIAPNLDMYKDVFRVLIKYNDRVGVENLWRLMVEMNVEPDTELSTLVEPFLEDARKKAWFE